MFDGMSIRKKCEFNKASRILIGYVDFGEVHTPVKMDDAPLTGDAVVFMVVGMAAPLTTSFGYFLNKGHKGNAPNAGDRSYFRHH